MSKQLNNTINNQTSSKSNQVTEDAIKKALEQLKK